MKKLNLAVFVLFISCAVLFGDDNSQKSGNTSTWIQNMSVVRKSLIDSNKGQELERIDTEIIKQLNEKDISNCEKEAAELIDYIIISKNYYSINNTADGLRLLYTIFSDKNYFLDTVFDIANYEFVANYLVLSTVLDGFRKCLGVNEDKLFKSYEMISPTFTPYIYDQSKIGSIQVTGALILFLNDYFILVEDGKLKGHYNSDVEETFEAINSSLRGDLKKYKGGSELQKNFNFYSNNRRERGAY